ncbi:MAG TPA: hypothetical protein VHR45_13695, partial [Thermoanaerobaculia bacterium]|nr:hypothetical protein [Thermoanaerobaculia bacterium]
MGTTEKPQLPPQRQAERPAAPAGAATTRAAARDPQLTKEIGAGIASGVKAVVKDAVFERRPYLKMAFANTYNLSLVSGALAAALLTANPLLALGALGLEALWLLHAPDSKRLRALLWDPRFERLKKTLEAQDRARRLAGLSPDERGRVEGLERRQEEIHRLAAENPSFAGDLLDDELVKTDRLVDAFVEMALTCARYESYLRAVDPGGL